MPGSTRERTVFTCACDLHQLPQSGFSFDEPELSRRRGREALRLQTAAR